MTCLPYWTLVEYTATNSINYTMSLESAYEFGDFNPTPECTVHISREDTISWSGFYNKNVDEVQTCILWFQTSCIWNWMCLTVIKPREISTFQTDLTIELNATKLSSTYKYSMKWRLSKHHTKCQVAICLTAHVKAGKFVSYLCFIIYYLIPTFLNQTTPSLHFFETSLYLLSHRCTTHHIFNHILKHFIAQLQNTYD